MSFALTENSKLVCIHQGSVKLSAGQSKLTVAGAKVLVNGDLNSATISSCPTADSSTSTKCRSVTSVVGGLSAKLKVEGKAVLLDTVHGTTDGVVGGPQTWSAQTAAQIRLKTG